jgi:ubiquinone biosynthesis protein UbiJ
MLDSAAAGAINHLLRREAWARERLLPFAGKTARLSVPPVTMTLAVKASGEVAAAQTPEPDVTVTVAAASLLDTLRDPQSAAARAEVSGDAEFARAIAYLFTHLRWDVEEDLSKVVGDVAAHRIARFGREAAQVPGRVASSVSRSIAAYLRDERRALPTQGEVASFNREVDALRDDVARLEKRLQRLPLEP